MTEEKKENQEVDSPIAEADIQGLGAAGRSLNNALKQVFFTLKILMCIFVLLFVLSGLKTVESGEQALVLRFGKIRGTGEDRLLGPGFHLLFPYPIDEIIRIPVEKKQNIAIDSFWYALGPGEKLGDERALNPTMPLRPIYDGYCLTRNDPSKETVGTSSQSDYNIVHTKWQLTYKIDDAERFYKNVYVEEAEPGQTYADVIPRSLDSFLKFTISDAIVTTMVNYSIDDVVPPKGKISKDVARLLSKKLDDMQSGIKVISVQLVDYKWPRQVDFAFQGLARIQNEHAKTITEARAFHDNKLSKIAGSVELADKLLEAIYADNLTAEDEDILWAQVSGQAKTEILQAESYRTKIVEDTRASADYLQALLPKYRQNPKLVIKGIYKDFIEYVLGNADEKMVVQPTETTEGREIRINLSRDPKLKPKNGEK